MAAASSFLSFSFPFLSLVGLSTQTTFSQSTARHRQVPTHQHAKQLETATRATHSCNNRPCSRPAARSAPGPHCAAAPAWPASSPAACACACPRPAPRTPPRRPPARPAPPPPPLPPCRLVTKNHWHRLVLPGPKLVLLKAYLVLLAKEKGVCNGQVAQLARTRRTA